MARLVDGTQGVRRTDSSAPRRTVVIAEAPGAESLRLRTIAGQAGFRVVSASSGHMIHTVARRSAPDLILLTPETGPPGPSEIARIIKETPETRGIPVIHVIDWRRFDEIAPRAYPTEALLPDNAPDEEFVKTMRMLTVRAPKVRYTKRSNAPLEGDLESDTFPEVLQFLFATSKTGRVSVSDGRRRGVICVESGRVVHASFGELEGIAAFRRMCFCQQGWFRFELDAAAPRRTMRADGIGLLLEAARQKDTADRTAVQKPKAPLARPEREPFAAPEPAPSPRRGWLGKLGLALLIAALLLAAFGVYAWTAG